MRARHRDVWRMAAKVAAVIRGRMLAPAKGEGGNEESPQRLGTSGAMWATGPHSSSPCCQAPGGEQTTSNGGTLGPAPVLSPPDTRVSPA